MEVNMLRRNVSRFPLVLALIMVAGFGTMAPYGVAARPIDTSPTKACRRYSQYAPFESPGTPFASAEECLMYADNGGTIVALLPNYAPFLDLRIGVSDQPMWCTLAGSMSGYLPRTT
jgi:hypothetical protein